MSDNIFIFPTALFCFMCKYIHVTFAYFSPRGTLKIQSGSRDWGAEVKELLATGMNKPR